MDNLKPHELQVYAADVVATIDTTVEYPHDLKVHKIREPGKGHVLLTHIPPRSPICERLECTKEATDLLRFYHWIHMIGNWRFEVSLCNECYEVLKGEFKYFEEELKQGVEFKYEVP